MMLELQSAKNYLLAQCPQFPKILITLGSGLGSLLSELELEKEISFLDIPHFKKATVSGHHGKLVVGKLGNKRVACLQGRLHLYEGYSIQEVVFPFRVIASCGTHSFLLTNASGGVHSDMKPGELMVIKDHINLMGTNPLIGKNEDVLGPRFPDMTQVYDRVYRELFLKLATNRGLKLRQGVYAAVHGPSYETPAEVQMLKTLGADAIGMSTAPEAIALRHMGKKVTAISCITNLAAGVGEGLLDHEEVLSAAKPVQQTFAQLVKEFVNAIE